MLEKFTDKTKIMKAHFVVCDCEEDSHNLKTDSSTCDYEAMTIVILTALVMKWQMES